MRPSGVFTATGSFDASANPARITVDLLPDTVHDLMVSGRVRQTTTGGCDFGGYTLSTTQDRNGDPLRIEQRLLRIFLPFLLKEKNE